MGNDTPVGTRWDRGRGEEHKPKTASTLTVSRDGSGLVNSSSVLGLETGNDTSGELLEHLGALDDVHGDPDLLDVGTTENGDGTSTSDSPVVYQPGCKGLE